MNKVIFLTPTDQIGASSRYRVYQYLDYLDKDIKYEVYPFMNEETYIKFKTGKNINVILNLPSLLIRRVKLLFKITKEDIVFIHRDIIPFGPMLFERILKLKGCKLILDLDDAVYCNQIDEISNNKNKFMYKMKYGKRFDKSIKLVDVVVCGNKFIENHVKKINDNTIIVPTVIDTNKMKIMEKVNNNILTIGWIGNPGNTGYIYRILKEIDKECSGPLNAILIGAKKFETDEFNNIKIMFYDWNLEKEYEYLNKCDVGLMPLNKSEWSEGKCGLKLLQYMAIGKPGIASDVGVNSEIIVEDKNGWIVSDEKDWIKIIKYLQNNYEKIKPMEDYCRKFVEDNYSINKWSPVINEILKNI